MKTVIVEIRDKAKNDFILELLASFPYLSVKEKKDFSTAEKKLVKKYKKSFNEIEGQPGKKHNPDIDESLPTEL